MWWLMPVIPATQEAEAKESLESRRQKLCELRSHHYTPAWATRVKLSHRHTHTHGKISLLWYVCVSHCIGKGRNSFGTFGISLIGRWFPHLNIMFLNVD